MHGQDICLETDMSRYSDVMFHCEQLGTANSPWYVTFIALFVVFNSSSVPASDAANRGGSLEELLP